jgi:type VI secretion system protein ImpA
MDIDVTALLAPIDGGSPCGEDVAYDPAFIELETLARGKAESQVGEAIIASEEPDYPEVVRVASEILGRAKDIRVAVILARAALRLDGPVAFARVLAYVRGCLETYWEQVHPLLDADDDNDPTMRVNAAFGLAGAETVLKALRIAPLTDSRANGRFSLRDILVANGEMAPPAGEKAPDAAKIAAAFKDTAPERSTALRAALREAREHVKAIDAVFAARIGAGGPDLSALDRLLHQTGQAMDRYLGTAAAEEAPAAAAGDEAPAGGGSAPRAAAAGQGGTAAIHGPNDVVRTLDRIVDYYERNEPSSPIPLLMKRARRLVNADFTTIIKDMAKGGLNQVQTIAGAAAADDDD